MSATMVSLGVVADSFGLPPKDALAHAAKLGFRGAQIDATAGDLDPSSLSRTGRRHVVRYTADLGLSLAALGGAFRRGHLADPAGLDERLDKLVHIMELAREVGAPAVTARIGSNGGGATAAEQQRRCAVEALRYLAERSDILGVTLAVETAGTPPATLAEILTEVGSPLVCACYDPAEVVIRGGDAIAGVAALADRIAVAHVRDATGGHDDRPGHEMPFGEGQIDFRAYLAALEQAGDRGLPLLRRHHAARPAEELAAGKVWIESLTR